jgi:hypothetical protein
LSSDRAADPGPAALVVPIDVVGLCVGEIDEQEATSGFAGPTAVFVEQTTERNPAFLGGNVSRSFDDAPGASQLTQGVHLHWALPDALTRADTSGGGLDFPACPNRWLVTRIVITGATATMRAWLLESDAVSAGQQTSQPVTVPVDTKVLPQGFGYLGRVSEPGAEDARAEAATSLAEAAGSDLTAVTNGEVGFAAYYPSCGSVFGFQDALDDLTPPAQDPAQLTYAVIGWFADPAKDPVQPGATPAALEKARRWTFAPAAPAPGSSLYSGVFQGVAWSPQQTYIDNRSVQQPLHVEAAIGGNPAEALSAYFNQKDKPPLKLFEQLLNAFQLGQLDRFTEPRPNQLTRLDEVVHDTEFAGMNAGNVYTLVARGKGGEPTELVDLPPQLADALNQLNLLEQRKHACLLHARWYRWQLFADWYRIFEIDPAKINDAFGVAYERYGGWSALQTAYEGLGTAAHAQRAAVEKQLAPGVRLRRVPATRYSQPADPAVLLTGAGIDFPERYGGDGRFDPHGNLVCRPGGSVLTAVTVAGKEIDASAFSAVAAPAGVPQPALVTALLREACLLSTAIDAAVSGEPVATLDGALQLALAGAKQTEYAFTGEPPSPVGMNWWTPDQWLPVFASWSVDYLPLLAVDRKTGSDTYPTRFINANYQVDQDAGGVLAYAPDGGPGSIEIDPATAQFTQSYGGSGHLTPSPAQTLGSLLKGYLSSHTDASLQTVLGQLDAAGFLVAPLAGLSELMGMRRQGIQLDVKVPEDSDYADFTDAVRPVVGAMNRVGPEFNGSYNPIRAGYLKLTLELVDVFGQKRAVQFDELVCSDAMTTLVDGAPLASVAYLQPRIAQPSRLLFRWLAADATAYEEATSHPAASPVCGWIVPNHLNGSLFLYNAQGEALGTLFLEQGGAAPVGWQTAPGSDATIDEDVATALRYENPQLRDLAVALKAASKETFAALWRVIDRVGDTVEPGDLPTNSGLAALVGRPVALAQAALRLEVDGHPYLNLWWDYLGQDTDNGFTGVQFPVVLGNLARLDDGLIGYFRQATPNGPYDLAHFYSQGADEAGGGGVDRPTQDTLCVTATPPVDTSEPPDLGPFTQKVLMLVDPRAQVHATTGVLPTAALSLPPDQTQASLASLDFSFFTAPVLRGVSGLTLPTPVESGYQLSWVEQSKASGALAWDVTPEIDTPSSQAVWAYTPQRLSEGWLRLNPVLLDFDLTDADGKPVVTGGMPNTLTLTVTNKATRSIAFRPGATVPEGTAPTGSLFYLHLGALVAQPDVPLISLSAPGWSFELFTSAQYGAYWAAAPQTGVVLDAGTSLAIAVTNLVPLATASQAQVYFDYYEIDGMSDGVYVDVLAVQTAPRTAATG